MKSVKKIVLGAAFFAALFAFAACKPQGPSEVATFEGKIGVEGLESAEAIYTVVCYDDNTFNYDVYYKMGDKSLHMGSVSGTYEGDVTIDGSVDLKVEKFSEVDLSLIDEDTLNKLVKGEWDDIELELKEYTAEEIEKMGMGTMKVVISDNGKTLTLFNYFKLTRK